MRQISKMLTKIYRTTVGLSKGRGIFRTFHIRLRTRSKGPRNTRGREKNILKFEWNFIGRVCSQHLSIMEPEKDPDSIFWTKDPRDMHKKFWIPGHCFSSIKPLSTYKIILPNLPNKCTLTLCVSCVLQSAYDTCLREKYDKMLSEPWWNIPPCLAGRCGWSGAGPRGRPGCSCTGTDPNNKLLFILSSFHLVPIIFL